MLTAQKPRELDAATETVHDAQVSVTRALNEATLRTAGPEWASALAARATRPLDGAIITPGANVTLGGTTVSLHAATSSTPLSGGLVPSFDWAGEEFGAHRRTATIATHSRKGKPYNVTKTINRQFPGRQKFGRVAFDAASEVGTKVVRAWVRAMVDAIGKPPFKVVP